MGILNSKLLTLKLKNSNSKTRLYWIEPIIYFVFKLIVFTISHIKLVVNVAGNQITKNHLDFVPFHKNKKLTRISVNQRGFNHKTKLIATQIRTK